MTLRQQEIDETDELKIKGAMLVRVRDMTPEERAAEGWEDRTEEIPCTEYDNGAVLYPACEQCDGPGTIYARYAGDSWGINSSGEPYSRPSRRMPTPRWVQLVVVLALLLTALVAAAAFTIWQVNQDQRDQVQQQQQIIREQRAMMDRQLENQRTIQRIMRVNQADVEKALDDIEGQVQGVVAERDGLRAANAQLSESNEELKKKGSGRGGR